MMDSIARMVIASNNILILPHEVADGDALGSSFALALAFTSMGKKVAVLLGEKVPFMYEFLPGMEFSAVYNKEAIYKDYDMAIAVDSGDTERLGQRRNIFESAAITVNIDHHITNSNFAMFNYVDTDTSSAAEIVYGLLELLGADISKDIALCLYVGITTDTGGFRFSNTSCTSHIAAAKLIKTGIDVADISQRVFDTISYEKAKLIGEAIRSLELFENDRIAVMYITYEVFKGTGALEEEFDGVINTARSIKGVEAAILLRQTQSGEIKVNLRSNFDVDVSAIASKYSGGGHKKAAGFTTKGTIEEVKRRLLADIMEAL